MSRLAQISVVAELETVDNLKLQVCVWITVVTIPKIAITSQTPVTLNIVPVVEAGKAKLEVTANWSLLAFWFIYSISTHLVPAEPNSVSVGAVV